MRAELFKSKNMFGRLLKNSPGQFPDLGLRVIASLLFSHLVESLGRDASILEQVQSKDYWIALLSGWLIAFFLWSQISMVSQHLDKRVDWMQEPLKRTSLQVLFGLVSQHPIAGAHPNQFISFGIRPSDLLISTHRIPELLPHM